MIPADVTTTRMVKWVQISEQLQANGVVVVKHCPKHAETRDCTRTQTTVVMPLINVICLQRYREYHSPVGANQHAQPPCGHNIATSIADKQEHLRHEELVHEDLASMLPQYQVMLERKPRPRGVGTQDMQVRRVDKRRRIIQHEQQARAGGRPGNKSPR
jgi:hypothetical protein